MKRISTVLSGTCLAVTLLLQGCEEGATSLKKPASGTTFTGPPVTATVNTTSGMVAFTASVVYKPAGTNAGTWVYTVASATGSPITRIDIIAPRNLKDCSLTAPESHNGSTTSSDSASEGTWTLTKNAAGNPAGFSNHGGAPSATFIISCNQQTNGPTYLLVADQAGTNADVTTAAGQNILGPIAGPN
jgi:hypothetical protein